MKIFMMTVLVIGLVTVTAHAAGVHFSLIEAAPGTWEVYAEVNGAADTLGISAYALWVYDIAPGSVSYEESNLFTLDEDYNIFGFTNPSAADYNNYPLYSGETAFNLGNYQNFASAIEGVGLTPVDEPGGIGGAPHVLLGVPALLGVLTTPECLGIEGKPTGVDTWMSPDFGLDTPGASLLNLAGDGYLSEAEVENVTYSVTPFVEPVLPLIGDANRDGVVSAADYAAVQTNFGNVGEEWMLGDANGDGVVSASDYSSIQVNFGNTSVETGTVPEPTVTVLLVLGGLAVLRRKGNRRAQG